MLGVEPRVRLSHLLPLVVFLTLACDERRPRTGGEPRRSRTNTSSTADAGTTGGVDASTAYDAGVTPIMCGGGRFLCGDRCVDLTSNPAHCGGCDNDCDFNRGEVCQDSACVVLDDCTVVPCIGLSYCDLATKHCKPGCDRNEQCGSGEACNTQTHLCECDTGFHRCSGQCVSGSEPRTCGARCDPCPGDPNGTATCDGTSCGITCNSGTHDCNGACVADTSVQTCGTSCTPCPGDPNGTATCDGTSCGIECSSSALMCGSACAPCSGGTSYTCDGDQCVPDSCGNGQRLCNGMCAQCPGDPNAISFYCDGASCELSDCADGFELCQGACATCPSEGVSRTACSGAACEVTRCISGYELCNGTCALCPSDPGAATFACSGTTCGIETCSEGYYRCASGCCEFTTEEVARGSVTAQARHSDIELSGTTVHVSYSMYRSSTSLYYASKTTGGTWTTESVRQGGYDNQLEVRFGAPHIAHANGGAWEVYVSSKSGGSWSTDIVDDQNRAASGIGFGIDSGGTFHVLYRKDSIYDLYYATGGPGNWSLEQVDANAFCTINTGELEVASDGTVRAAYCSYSRLHFASRSTSSWSQMPVDDARAVDDVSLALDAQDNPHIAYFDNDLDDLWYAHHDGSSWTMTLVDETGRVGEYNEIAVDAAGRPHISYYDASRTALKYATFDGTAWRIATVESSGDVGKYTAIKVSSGSPHITYAKDNTIRYAR